MWRLTVAIVLMFGVRAAWGDDPYPVSSPSYPSFGPEFGQGAVATAQPPGTMPGQGVIGPGQPAAPGNPAWPPPGRDPRRNYAAGQQDWLAPAAPPTAAAVTVPAAVEKPTDSTWYFRQDAFFWNERSGSGDSVNEYGPLSTLGYVRHFGIERFRIELFGGTVAYDGAAQITDGSQYYEEPYHQSFGTSYLGCRGEYDLLIEPANWSWLRGFVGFGTRFWIRDLKDAVTPSGIDVAGYQETWWTFYPYIGLETKDSSEPGLKFFGSMRFGVTPLTYQYATYFDTVVYPRCGLTGQMELGVRFQKFSLSACVEAMTWGKSNLATDAYGNVSFQPDSRMLTIGGKLAYTF